METERLIPMTESEVRAEMERQMRALGIDGDVPPGTKRAAIRDAIRELAVELGRPVRAREIVGRTGFKHSTVSVEVMRLRHLGEIVGGGFLGYVPVVER